jgi:hypothetical protein
MNENKKSGFCIAGMVFGIISIIFCCFGFLPGLLGLIFSIISLAKKKQPKGCAIAGLITSIIGIILGLIVGIILLVVIITSGIFVGGVAAGLSKLSNEIQSGNIDVTEYLNAAEGWENYLDGDGYDFDPNGWNIDDFDWDGSSINSGDYNFDFDSDYDFSELEDLLLEYDTESSDNGGNDDYSEVYFEDLDSHGFKFVEDIDGTYIYTKNGAEYEYPAYIYYGYSEDGSTTNDAYLDYLDYLDFTSNPDSEYASTVTYYSSEWDYGWADQITDYGDYEYYEIWLFCFNKYSDELVILIARPDLEDPDGIDEAYDELVGIMDYMYVTD